MQVLIILAHPTLHSFNHAIVQTAKAELKRNGHQVTCHDLYAEGFDPILSTAEIPKAATLPQEIERHCQEIASADGIIIVHPNWWGQPPAILKGWVDRVIRPGIAYQFVDGDQGEGIPIGLLKAKAACIFNTSNTTPERELSVFGDPLETLWKHCVFGLCGVNIFHRETFSIVVTSTMEHRQKWLVKVREVMQQYFPKENCA
jgi:putative NADPH-quinone reductase